MRDTEKSPAPVGTASRRPSFSYRGVAASEKGSTPMTQPSPASLWTGRVLTGLFALFMLGASIAPKLLGMAVVDTSLGQLGWPPGYGLLIGVIELALLILYLVPRTSLFGAV